MISNRVENTVAKGEIARNEQFLLFPKCFQKTCKTHKNQGLFGKGLSRLIFTKPQKKQDLFKLKAVVYNNLNVTEAIQLIFDYQLFSFSCKCSNPLPHNHKCYWTFMRGLLRILWEKEKMLVTIFSFTYDVFYYSQNKFQFFSTFI